MIKGVIRFAQKLYKKLPVILFDMLAIPFAWYLADWLRFNMQPTAADMDYQVFYRALAVLLPVQLGCYYYFRVYRGLWRFSSLNDLIRIIQSVITATVLVIPLFYQLSLLHGVPRSVPLLYIMMLTATLCSARLLMRNRWDYQFRSGSDSRLMPVLIVGAGAAGEWLVRDLRRSRQYLPVAIVDDNRDKQGLEVHGIRVSGTIDQLADIARKKKAALILIAIPSASSQAMRRIVSQCEKSGIAFRTLPGIADLALGKVSVQSLREVSLEDLLGRDQVELDWQKIAADISGHKVLVTGGGGSIGAELCRQIMALQPAELQIIESCEYNLYEIEKELSLQFPKIPLKVCLASVTDVVAVNAFLSSHQPSMVFHSAAYKHVPMLESQVRAAVQNNIIGTQIIAQAAVGVGVEKFVLISTDKAVNPSNVMGTTKRVAEIYCQNLNEKVDTCFITVRFGNVLGSAGSVIPLFHRQLQQGGPLTVTHPEIQRYFMTIPEASQLILQAMSKGEGGEIFVLDMGKPIKIKYLAEQMIRLSGYEPYKDIDIEFTGLRAGEKLFEELFHESEQLRRTSHQKLFMAQYRVIDWQDLNQTMRMMEKACMSHQDEELMLLLKSLVPEFQFKAEIS